MKHQIPETVSGYELDENDEWGLFDIIVPQQCINHVHNPSMARGSTSGYTVGVGCSIGLTTTHQRRGLYSLEVTPTSNGEATVYYNVGNDNLIAGGSKLHFSCDILGNDGVSFYIYVTDNAGVMMTEKVRFKATGEWMRVSVGWTTSSDKYYRLYIERIGTSTATFYLDGFVCEHNLFASTYCDGDQVGFLINRKDYGWEGERCGSRSWRLGKSRSGGYKVNLKKLGFHLTGIIGLGMNPVEPIALDMASGSALYQKTRDLQREFSLVGTIYGTTRSELMRVKEKLSFLLSSKSYYPDQPLILSYCKKDDRGFATSKEYEITCVYLSGLEGVTDNNNAEGLNIRFKLYDPYIQSSGNRGAILYSRKLIEDVSTIIRRSRVPSAPNLDTTASWDTVGGGVESTTTYVAKIMQGPVTGYIYMLLLDENTDNGSLYYYNGSTWTFISPSGGMNVEWFDLSANEDIWAVTFDSGAGQGYFEYYNRSLGTWTTLDGYAYAPEFCKVDTRKSTAGKGVFAVGYTGVPVAWDTLWYYDIDAGTITMFGDIPSMSDIGWVDINPNTEVVYVISVDHINHDVEVYQIADETTWELIGTFTSASDTYDPLVITVTRDGRVYIGGCIDSQVVYTNRFGNSVTLSYSGGAYWDGYDWREVSSLANLLADSPSGSYIRAIYELNNGQLAATGNFSSKKYGVSYGVCLFDQSTIHNIGWYPTNGFDSDSHVSFIYTDSIDRLYLGFGELSSAEHDDFVDNNLNEVDSHGDGIAYPTIEIRGPVEISYLHEGTIGHGLLFTNGLIADREYINIRTSPYGIKAQSNWRGNMLSMISPYSDFNYRMQPGTNYPQPFAKTNTHSVGDTSETMSGWDKIDIPPYSTDEGIVYVTLSYSAPNYTISLYKDSAKTQLIAHTASFTTIGAKTLIEDNNSNVVGSITVDILPGETKTFLIYVGYIAILWREAHTSIFEDKSATITTDRPYGEDVVP